MKNKKIKFLICLIVILIMTGILVLILELFILNKKNEINPTVIINTINSVTQYDNDNNDNKNWFYTWKISNKIIKPETNFQIIKSIKSDIYKHNKEYTVDEILLNTSVPKITTRIKISGKTSSELKSSIKKQLYTILEWRRGKILTDHPPNDVKKYFSQYFQYNAINSDNKYIWQWFYYYNNDNNKIAIVFNSEFNKPNLVNDDDNYYWDFQISLTIPKPPSPEPNNLPSWFTSKIFEFKLDWISFNDAINRKGEIGAILFKNSIEIN